MFLISPLKTTLPCVSFFSDILPIRTQLAENFSTASLLETLEDVYLGTVNFGIGGGA